MKDYSIPDSVLGVPPTPSAWTARWISHPDSAQTPTGVYRFRKTVTFDKVRNSVIIRVSADNRYRLYVNGTEVGAGPGRGSLLAWKYETYEIAPLLKLGVNVFAAVVWYASQELAAIAQFGYAPGFLLSTEMSDFSAVLDTSADWRSSRLSGHTFFEKDEIWTYCVVGPCERIEGAALDTAWKSAEYDDSQWTAPAIGLAGEPYGIRDAAGRRMLIANRLPQPVRELRVTSKVVDSVGLEIVPQALSLECPITVPRNSTATILLDNLTLTTSYPQLSVKGGAGSLVRQRYAEALSEPGHLENKGNRNEIADKVMVGYHDEFLPDGSELVFKPLWYRTFRYVRLEIETGSEDLIINGLAHEFTAYPFEEIGSFSSSDGTLARIWKVGWLTARLCALEHYMDCPYYEQLQYVGDTKLQCLVSYYVSGDGRLARNAIEQLRSSMIPAGLTQSRYPSNLTQIIPPFSLWWIGMVRDYWMYQDDAGFVAQMLPAGRFVLEWFIDKLAPGDGRLLGPLPFWNFVDWSDGYPDGVPPGATEGSSAALTLQLILALREQAAMESVLGAPTEADQFNALADELLKSVVNRCWDGRRGLLAETPDKREFSQHTNSLAILAGAFTNDIALSVGRHILEDSAETLIQSGFYFRYYVHQALRKAGLADHYLEWLGDWHEMLSQGLSTFAEKPDPVRSDCHAWSAHPIVGLLQIVLGVQPSQPGFREVSIDPHLGALDWAEGTVPHPAGKIIVRLDRVDGQIKTRIQLPDGVSVGARQ